jgi:hypothetical protein
MFKYTTTNRTEPQTYTTRVPIPPGQEEAQNMLQGKSTLRIKVRFGILDVWILLSKTAGRQLL